MEKGGSPGVADGVGEGFLAARFDGDLEADGVGIVAGSMLGAGGRNFVGFAAI